MALEDMEVWQLLRIARNKGWELIHGTQRQLINFIRDIESFKMQSREVKREYRKVERKQKKKKAKGKRKK